MESNSEQYAIALVFISTLVLAYLIDKLLHRHRESKRKLPPTIGCLPIVGSFFFLPKIEDMHEFFLEKSYKLGNVFSFSMGNMYSVVLNSRDVIHEALVKRANDFSSRPTYYGNRYANISAKGFLEHYYNAEFKKYHKLSLCILKRFGFGTTVMENRINAEVVGLIKDINRIKGKSFEPQKLVCESILKIISGITLNCHSDQPDDKTLRIFELVHRQMHESIDLVALDVWPALRFLPVMRKSLKNHCDVFNELIALLSMKVDENISPDAEENFSSCFVEGDPKYFDRAQLVLTLRDFIVAGTETSSSAVLWSLVLLGNNLEVQERLHKEIDSIVPRDRLPSLDDKCKLVYVEAVILEIMRIRTLVPLALPHATTTDTEVGGYFIPRNTMIFVNLFAVHMNINEWKEPDVFRPDRFIDSAGNIVNKNLVIPFSVGKRSCIGELLARQEVYLFLTGLLQNFNILPPEGKSGINCKPFMKATLAPTSFEVRLVPRTI